MNLTRHLVLYFSLLFFACTAQKQSAPRVQTGLDRVNEYQQLFNDTRVGIVTNHTAYNSQGQYIADIFLKIFRSS